MDLTSFGYLSGDLVTDYVFQGSSTISVLSLHDAGEEKLHQREG